MIVEGLEFNDIAGIISPVLQIDRFTPKVSSDDAGVVMAFVVRMESAAADLRNFIESAGINLLDVDISDAPDTDGNYFVFVEFIRDYHLYQKMQIVLDMVDHIMDEKTNWKFRGYNQKTIMTFNKENVRNTITMSAVRYRMDHN